MHGQRISQGLMPKARSVPSERFRSSLGKLFQPLASLEVAYRDGELAAICNHSKCQVRFLFFCDYHGSHQPRRPAQLRKLALSLPVCFVSAMHDARCELQVPSVELDSCHRHASSGDGSRRAERIAVLETVCASLSSRGHKLFLRGE
eukprot:s6628_g5.t1